MRHKSERILFIIFLIFTLTTNAHDLEPRILSPVPIGINFAVASYGNSSGDILTDNTLPIEDLDAKLNSIVFGYMHSFKLLNKLAKFDIVLPYSFAHFEANVDQLDSSTERSGFADPSTRLSVLLIGNKPLTPTEFSKTTPQKFNLGLQLKVKIPIGKYDETKLLNLGSNRWSLKTGIASSYMLSNKLILETQLNTWWFTKNNEFYNGNSLNQNPLLSAQIHLTYVFKPGVWIAISTGKSTGGETILNTLEKDDSQNNSRYGIVFANRLNNNNSLKFAFTSGVSTRYGSNFTTFLIAYQFMWMKPTLSKK